MMNPKYSLLSNENVFDEEIKEMIDKDIQDQLVVNVSVENTSEKMSKCQKFFINKSFFVSENKQNSKYFRLVTIIVTVIVLAFSCSLIYYFWSSNEIDFANDEHIILLSNNINKSLDTSIDPCDDFYEYACGQWINNFSVLNGDRIMDVYSLRSYANQLVVKQELERLLIQFSENGNTSNGINEAELKAALFYKSCLLY